MFLTLFGGLGLRITNGVGGGLNSIGLTFKYNVCASVYFLPVGVIKVLIYRRRYDRRDVQ